MIAAIDYSITSPCLCIFNPQKPEFNESKFYILNNFKKQSLSLIKKFNNISFTEHDENYKNYSERYHNISEHFLNIMKWYDIDYVIIEGYSMGSRNGLIFNIAENTGILKYKLWLSKYVVDVVPPTTIKKFATTKGNSNKIAMNIAFEEKTNIILHDKETSIGKSPFSDIIDSYFIALYQNNIIKNDKF